MLSQTKPFKNLLEAVPDALVGVDQAGVIQFVNRQTELLFGYDRDDLVGQPIETLVPESLRQVHTAHRDDNVADPRTRAMGLDLELSGRQRDGTVFPVEISLSHMDTENDLLVVAAARDITDGEKSAEKDYRMSQLAAIVEDSGDAILSAKPDGIITSWNPAAERMFGYSSEEVIGKSVELMIPERGTDATNSILATVRADQPVWEHETVRARKDGTAITVSLNVSPIHDADGAVVGISGIARDVTERTQALETDRNLAAIVENSDEAIIGKTLEGLVTSWNPAAERMFGYSSEEIIGKSIDVLSPDERSGEIDSILARIRAGQPVEHLETIRVRKDGAALTVSLSVSPIQDADGVIVGASTITRDVTEQMQAFQSARSMIESSLDSLVSISPEGRITDVNEATTKVTGIPRETLIGTAFSDYFTEPEKANAIYQRVFAEGMAVDYPLTMRHRDGTLTDVLYNASVYRDTGGNVLGVFAAARDVTKQKQAFESARSMIESSLDSLVSISPEGKITDVNEAAVKVTGVPRDKLIGTEFSQYFTEPDKANEIYQRVVARGMAVDYPLTMRHRDGTLTEVLYNASVYRDTGGKVLGVFAAARDVTEQKRAQAEIAQQAKELDRLAELERFQRLTVGRELKMIELKKEIEFLRKFGPADGGETGDEH
jgi:PAS domain S-box-containing protein